MRRNTQNVNRIQNNCGFFISHFCFILHFRFGYFFFFTCARLGNNSKQHFDFAFFLSFRNFSTKKQFVHMDTFSFFRLFSFQLRVFFASISYFHSILFVFLFNEMKSKCGKFHFVVKKRRFFLSFAINLQQRKITKQKKNVYSFIWKIRDYFVFCSFSFFFCY